MSITAAAPPPLCQHGVECTVRPSEAARIELAEALERPFIDGEHRG